MLYNVQHFTPFSCVDLRTWSAGTGIEFSGPFYVLPVRESLADQGPGDYTQAIHSVSYVATACVLRLLSSGNTNKALALWSLCCNSFNHFHSFIQYILKFCVHLLINKKYFLHIFLFLHLHFHLFICSANIC